MAIVDVASEAELEDGQALSIVVNDIPIAVFNVNGEYFAISDTCTHEEFPLSEGDVDAEERTVECALHGARFDLHSGEALSLPATIPVDTYQVWVEDGTIKVEVP